MKFTIQAWRQSTPDDRGHLARYEVDGVSPDMSFLEMLDLLNETLTATGSQPIAFDHDCREGICGSCGFVINGTAHGPRSATTVCQLHMRSFRDGEVLTLEPWRAAAFPVIKDLVVDRSALDRIVQAGGYVSVPAGSAPEANSIPVAKDVAERVMDAAACIGCGACVAACPNAAAMLFTGAFVTKLNLLPQGAPEATLRLAHMIERMDAEGFGSCSNHRECEAACPKGIRIDVIATLNRGALRGAARGR